MIQDRDYDSNVDTDKDPIVTGADTPIYMEALSGETRKNTLRQWIINPKSYEKGHMGDCFKEVSCRSQHYSRNMISQVQEEI